ncbi:hypothetical protein L8106_22291 [Lyngbya sp. PCC 8106]|nr:hypothetical protein L8106_22291 [Lyngbya sp. PCC 8106]
MTKRQILPVSQNSKYKAHKNNSKAQKKVKKRKGGK